MFNKANQTCLVDNVVDQIESAIVRGELKPGDKLPPGEKLQQAFGASRGTLREAFRVLRQKGLLKAKAGAGGGVFVKALSPDPVRESLSLLIRTRGIPIEQLAAFREGMEGCAAELAAVKAGPEQISELAGMVSELDALAARGLAGWDAFHKLEADMHMTLVRFSGNKLYEFNAQVVHENIDNYYRKYLPRDESVLKRNCLDWKEMLAALKAGDAERVADKLRRHIKRFSRDMISAKGGE